MALAALTTVAALAVVVAVLLQGETADPFAYSPANQSRFERDAAAGESHLLYANSPGGAVATARRVVALDGPIRVAAAASHVPPALLEGIVYLESGGRANAVAGADPSAAAGVSQILPVTARNLLGLHVDLAASRRLTAQILAAEHAHDAGLAGRLERQRAKVDERFEPARSLAAMGRYLSFALGKLSRVDLAVESYHMGVGNLANVIRSYAGTKGLAGKVVQDQKLSYAQLYFDSTPARHSASYKLLAALGDDSATYYWRVLAAEDIIALYRQSPAALGRTSQLETSYPSAEAVLHPPGSTQVFDTPAAIEGAKGALRAIPNKPANHFTLDPSIATQAQSLGRNPRPYETLRPEALGVLYYLGDRVFTISHAKAPLLVAAATRDVAYENALAARQLAPRQGYSLYTTGWSFDIKRSYASPQQAQAFQQMLDRLQALDVIAWARQGGVIHITASAQARTLSPLVDGASLGDGS